MALTFKNAEEARDAILASQKKEIASLYEKWADEIGERAKYYSHKSNASAAVSERQMRELEKMLRATSQEVSNEIYNGIKKNMYTISDAVVKDNIEWLKTFGFSEDGLNAAFNFVPDMVVRNLITGQIYDSGWSLSARIWGNNEETLKDTYRIMAKGMAENKSVYEISKELEAYVRPSAKLPWNPVIAMKNTKTGKIEYKRIYKNQVDYNAQKLARTLAQHSYQQSFLATTQKNPFITEYIWHSNGSRPCPLCLDRDGKHFHKDELPMDHPNGMCTMEPVVAENMVDQLADWFNSPDGTYPEIDEFAGNFGYESKVVKTAEDFKNKYGTSDKSLAAWHNSLTHIQKLEAQKLKEQYGQTWQQFYEKNGIYTGTGSSKHTKKVVSKIAGKIDEAFESANWLRKIKAQDEAHMLALEDESMKLIGEAGRRGIRVYSGSSYEEMNAYLRFLASGMDEATAIRKSYISASQLQSTKDAIEGLNNAKLTESLVLRRGTDLGDLAGAFMSGDFGENKRSLYGKSVKELNEMFSGAVGKFGSFTSTSSLWDRGFSGDVEVVLLAPKGTSASSIMSISRFGTSEGETLLNAGTTVRCIKIEESDGHKGSDIRVFMEIIPK